MPTKAVTLQCPVCTNNVTKTQNKVGCGICGCYYHPTCAGITSNMFEMLNKTHAAFICKICSNSSGPASVNDDIFKHLDKVKKSIENKMDRNKIDIEEQMNSGFSNLEEKVDGLLKSFRNEVDEELSKIKSDVSHCYSVVKEVDEATNLKVKELMATNNMLVRRLNRSDILFFGLPNKMDKIHEHIIRIGELVGVNITAADINHCCFINKRKCILVKFNSVYLRDKVMAKYYKAQPIYLKSILNNAGSVGGVFEDEAVVDGAVASKKNNNGSKDEARVYLNDNLSPDSLKLKYICRKLILQKKIQKYQIINMDIPKVKVVKSNGSVSILAIQQCLDLLDGTFNDDGGNVNGGDQQ